MHYAINTGDWFLSSTWEVSDFKMFFQTENSSTFCLMTKLMHMHKDNFRNIGRYIGKKLQSSEVATILDSLLRTHNFVSVGSECKPCFRTLFWITSMLFACYMCYIFSLFTKYEHIHPFNSSLAFRSTEAPQPTFWWTGNRTSLGMHPGPVCGVKEGSGIAGSKGMHIWTVKSIARLPCRKRPLFLLLSGDLETALFSPEPGGRGVNRRSGL